MNVICVKLAGVTTFLVGIDPATWWEKDRAAKATRIALWVALLRALVVMILLLQKG